MTTQQKEEHRMTETAVDKTRNTAIRNAYSSAAKRLREAHLDEFHKLQIEEAKKLGVDWAPKPNAEQKAEAELIAILKDHPALADRLYSELDNQRQGEVHLVE